MSHGIAITCDRAIAEARSGGPTPQSKSMVLWATTLASSLAIVDGGVLNVALPAITESFKASTAQTQWVLNAFLLPLSALLLLGGSAGDIYGRRRLLISGMVIFAAASLLCAVAPTIEVLLAGRVLQGTGAAMLMPNSLAILGRTFSGDERGRAIGVWAAAGAAVGAVAPVLGGWLVDQFDWRAIFLLKLPIAAVAIRVAIAYVPESDDEERPSPDWPGAVLVTIGLAALTWSLTVLSGGSVSTISTLIAAGGVIALLLFLHNEGRRRDRAMIPLSLFGSAPFVGLIVVTFMLYGAFGGVLVLLPYTLIEAADYSAFAVGAALLPLPLVIAGASPMFGRLAERTGQRLPLTAGPLTVGCGFAVLSLADITGSYWTSLLPALLLVSAGMAMAVAPITSAVLSSVDSRHTGIASGLNSAVARTGGLLATALLGAVLSKDGAELVASLDGALLLGAGTAVGAGLTAFATLGARRGSRAGVARPDP